MSFRNGQAGRVQMLTSLLPEREIKRRYLADMTTAMPRPMPAPPGVSYSVSNAATNITNPIENPITSVANVTGCQATSTQVSDSLTFYSSSVIGDEFPPCIWTFETDAPAFDVVYLGTVAPVYRLLIDGEYVAATPTTAGNATSGHATRMRVTFPDRQWRRVALETAGMPVTSVTTSRVDSIVKGPPLPFRMGFLGDSYTQNGGLDGIAMTAAKLLRVEPFINGAGGTGYLATGPAPRTTFASRIASFLSHASLDGMVLMGGINDGTTGLSAAVTSLLQTIIGSGISPRSIWVVGPWAPPSSVGGSTTKLPIIQAAASALGCRTIDNITVPWITGTGNSSSLAGDGNADTYIGSDTTHPVPNDGYTYHGVRLAQAIVASLTEV